MFIFFSIVLFVFLIISLYYMVRFARIIMALEDDFENSIEILNRADKSIDGLLELKMFFDSKELIDKVQVAKDDIRVSKMAISKLISVFIQRSKNKYITEVAEE